MSTIRIALHYMHINGTLSHFYGTEI